MFIFQDLSFLHKGVETLIFKLEMCVHVFINKKTFDSILALFYTIFVNLYTIICKMAKVCKMAKAQFSLPKSRINEYS